MTASSSYTERRVFFLRVLLAVLLLLLAGKTLSAQKDQKPRVQHDSSSVQLQEPSAEAKDEVYKDEYWRYGRDDKEQKEEPNIFDRMWNSFLENLMDGMNSGSKGISNFWSIFWIVVLVALVVFVILKTTGTGLNSVFSGKRKKAENIDATMEDVDIHALDYEQMIADAVRRGDYRLCVRLWFLRTLKTLSDKELLEYKIDKTNSDYYYDLSGSTLQKEFGDVSLIYDYIWYGEVSVDESGYRQAEERFRTMHTKIESL